MAQGDMVIVRYADDFAVGFEHEADARRFWDALRARLEVVRTIGIARAKAKIGLQNLAYNIRRLVTLERMAAA
jgi:hypothetical protein